MADTRVKVCGITSVDDALGVVQAGADALGFVFYEKSPRNVAPQQVAAIVSALPPFITTVGLFVNTEPEEISRIMAQTGLQVVQLHGDESPEQCHIKNYPIIKALRVRDETSLRYFEAFPVSAILLDAWSDGQYGGTGRQFDWQLLRQVRCDKPVILAGGLTPDNVRMAIRQVTPYAVDVSSGVECSPGHKDMDLVTQFIQQVKQA